MVCLFHRSGYMSLGYSWHYDYAEGKPVSGTATFNWAKTGYEHFVAFYVDDAISEKLDHELGEGRGYLFRDNSQTVTAPAITYTNGPMAAGSWPIGRTKATRQTCQRRIASIFRAKR